MFHRELLPPDPRYRRLHGLLAVASTIALLFLTLRPDHLALNGLSLVPFAETSRFLRIMLHSPEPFHYEAFRRLLWHVGGNVGGFIPLGLGLAGWRCGVPARRAWGWAVAVSCLLSLGIELAQLAIPSRSTDVDDVIFNTLGAMLGATLALWRRRPQVPGAASSA